jgi:diguanylate cyclase (GGDEF)-like protein
MLARLRTDFQLGILSLFGLCAVFGVTPFAVFRFVTGNVLAGSIDLGIVLAIAAGVAYAWRSGNTRGASIFVMTTSLTGCVSIATLLGVPGLFWMYPTLLASFLLVGHRLAGMAAVVALGVLALHGRAFVSALEALMFLTSASIVVLFALLFALRTEAQRQRLERLATSDPLTGAFNRRTLDGELERAIAWSHRHGSPLGVAVLDLDHFKRINDARGHDVGDRVLIDFVALVQGRSRAEDRLFRMGGEEFLLLLPGTSADALGTVAETLRREVAARLSDGVGPVTVSIGAAALAAGETRRAWLARADAALYRAKAAGRDRVVVAEAAEPSAETVQA